MKNDQLINQIEKQAIHQRVSGVTKQKNKLLAVALSLLIFPMVFSADAIAGKKGSHGHHHEKFLDQLELSEEQEAKLAEIRKADRSKMKELRGKLKKARKNLEGALRADTSNEELRKLNADVQKLQDEMDTLRFERILSIREILTPEQRKKFLDLKSEFRKKHMKGWKGKKK